MTDLERDTKVPGNPLNASGVSSEHNPPHHEPDRQPPSDGGLLPISHESVDAELEALHVRLTKGDYIEDLQADMLYAAYCALLWARGYGTLIPSRMMQWNTRANPPAPEEFQKETGQDTALESAGRAVAVALDIPFSKNRSACLKYALAAVTAYLEAVSLPEARAMKDDPSLRVEQSAEQNTDEVQTRIADGGQCNEHQPHAPSLTSLKSTQGPFRVERIDQEDGAICYELWGDPTRELVLSISDDFNPKAKADIELICKLLNNQHPE